MGKHSLGENQPFWRGLVLFVLKWLGIAVLPALAIFGLLSLVLGDGDEVVETQDSSPTVQATTTGPPASPAASPPPQEPQQKGPIQVLNGTNRRGLAATAQERLQEAGYEAPDIGDAAGRYQRTTVFYQPGFEALAQEIADLLGAEVISPAPDNLQRDVPITLVLGDDYQE